MPAVLDELLKGASTKGITNYLIGQTDDFKSLSVNDPAYKTLDIYTSGPIPPNPAELLLSNKMNLLFQQLRESYDYIIVDSAPAGLVSDAFILQQNVDITLYIIRQQYTLLKQLDFIAELYESEKLKNVSLVVNDVVMGGRYGYYGYNYGYGYAYSYQYGYGYKYTKSTGNYYTDMTESMYRPWWVRVINIFRRKKA
jgi:Mrp family chromosome partitioning ATPase